jgi:hypothetical protein
MARKRFIALLFYICWLFFFYQIRTEAFQESLDDQTRYRIQTKKARRITPQQAHAIYKTGKALLISVDQADYYKMEHIIGSINIPLETLKNVKLKVSKNKPIILYCR